MEDQNIRKLRGKRDILKTLKEAVSEGDIKVACNTFRGNGSMLWNKFQSESNPASIIGWVRTEDGKLYRVEGEERPQKIGNSSLAIKMIEVPKELQDEMGISETNVPVPNYINHAPGGFWNKGN
jgi:hypothetical protein